MTLSFGANDIHDTVRYKDVMMEYGLGRNGKIITFERGEDATIGTKAILLHHVLVPHHVTDIITAESRLTIDTYS
jgi:hypothetical protein